MNARDRRAWPREFRDTLERLDAFRDEYRAEQRDADRERATARWRRRREIVAWTFIAIGGAVIAYFVW